MGNTGLYHKTSSAGVTFWMDYKPLAPEGVTIVSLGDLEFLNTDGTAIVSGGPTMSVGTKTLDPTNLIASARIIAGSHGLSYVVYWPAVLSNGDTPKPWRVLTINDGYIVPVA